MSRIEDLEKRLAKDPQSKVFAQLAEEYRKLGLLEDAIHTCREGLEVHPNYFSARVALGRSLLEANSLEEAATELEKVLAQVPDNILANKFLGETYHKLGRLEEAIAKYRVAQALSPEDADIADRVSQVEAQQASPPPPPPAYQEPTPAVPEHREEVPSQPLAADAKAKVEPAPEMIDSEKQPPSPAVKRQVQEMGDVSPVSEEARAIQEEIEQSFPTDVMQRQVREIRNFEMMPPPEAAAASRDTLAEDPAPPESPFETQAETPPPPVPKVSAEAAEAPLPEVSAEAPLPEVSAEAPLPEVSAEAPLPEVPAEAPLPEVSAEEQPVLVIDEDSPPSPSLESDPLLQVPSEPSTAEELAASQPGLASTTLAELYASQGHIEQALDVFRDLLSSRPNDPQMTQRIEELEMLARARTDMATQSKSRHESFAGAALQAQTIQETIRVLEGWLVALREP